MALELNGNYIRISKENVKANLEKVLYNTYKDKQTRENPSQFDLFPQMNTMIEISDEFLNSVVTTLYSELKKTPEFENALDV